MTPQEVIKSLRIKCDIEHGYVVQLRKRVYALEPMRRENVKLRNEVDRLQKELRWHRQYSREANIEILELKKMLRMRTEGGQSGLQENSHRAAP